VRIDETDATVPSGTAGRGTHSVGSANGSGGRGTLGGDRCPPGYRCTRLASSDAGTDAPTQVIADAGTVKVKCPPGSVCTPLAGAGTDAGTDAATPVMDAGTIEVACPPGYLCTPIGVVSSVSVLSYDIIDAEESKSLDSIVMISDTPANALHIFAEATGSDRTVALNAAPVAVAVDPSGTHAAVAFDGHVSHVDLVTGTVITTCMLSSNAADLTLTDSGIAYVVPLTDQWVPLHVLDLVTCDETPNDTRIWAGSRIMAHPSGAAVFVSQWEVPDNIQRCDITGSEPVCADSQDFYDHGTYEVGHQAWTSVDGERIYSAGGTTLRVPSPVNGAPCTYGGMIAGVSTIQHMSEAVTAQQLAIIPADPGDDSVIRIHATPYLELVQQLSLPSFPLTGGATTGAHGRFVFVTPTLDRLSVIVQADSAGGAPLHDFAVATLRRAPTNSNGNGDSAAEAGGSDADAASLDDATVPDGDGGTAAAQVSVLPYRVVDAQRSASLSSIVMVSDTPTNTLHILDEATRVDRRVMLPTGPIAVAIDPSGKHAAVAHDAYVSHVDLVAGTVLKTCPLTTHPGHLTLTDAGVTYVVQQVGQLSVLRQVDLVTCTEITGPQLEPRSHIVAHPSGDALFTNQEGSPQRIERCDLTVNPIVCKDSQGLNDWGTYDYGYNLWMSADGLRIYTAAGATLSVPVNVNAQNLTYGGSLPGVSYIQHLCEAPTAHQIAFIPGGQGQLGSDSVIRIHDTTDLGFSRELGLPPFPVAGSQTTTAHGHFVFATDTLDKLYVIVQADEASGTVHDFAVATVTAP
jgi:hypothetical protein